MDTDKFIEAQNPIIKIFTHFNSSSCCSNVLI